MDGRLLLDLTKLSDDLQAKRVHVGQEIIYFGARHRVIDAGGEQGFRVAALPESPEEKT